MEVTAFHNPIYLKFGFDYEGEFLILFGSAGSGKSVFGVHRELQKKFLARSKQKILVVRKVQRDIKDSIYDLMRQSLEDWGVAKHCKFITSPAPEITHRINGNKIIFRGCDDVNKLKSINGVTSIIVEEADQLTQDDFLQVMLRMRGESEHVKQITLMFNPTSDKSWLVPFTEPQYLEKMPENVRGLRKLNKSGNVWEFKTETEAGDIVTTRVLNTTYKHNKKLTKQDAARLRMLASISTLMYTVYERGRWGKIQAGDRYAHNFTEALHVAPCSFDETRAVHFTCDFNVSPYMSGLVCQIVEEAGRMVLKVIQEYSLKHPLNTASDMGTVFSEDYAHVLGRGWFLYGDASGNNRTGNKGARTLFADLLQGCRQFINTVEERIPTTNPRYKHIAAGSIGRRFFTNLLLSKDSPIKIIIDPSCKNLIKDLNLCEQDVDGKLAKPKTKGVELRGHHLQALEYLTHHKLTFGGFARIKK